jgi:hypothetical protein
MIQTPARPPVPAEKSAKTEAVLHRVLVMVDMATHVQTIPIATMVLHAEILYAQLLVIMAYAEPMMIVQAIGFVMQEMYV